MGTVTDTVPSLNYTINDATVADTITVAAGPVGNGFQTTSVSDNAGADIIDFANKTAATLNCTDDSDAIFFSNPFAAAGLQSLTVENLGPGATINGFFSLPYVHVGSGFGSVTASASGVVTIDAAIVPGASVATYGTGEVLLSSFNTVSVGTGGSISTAINFSGPGGVLQVTDAADSISGQIAGFSGGDFIDDQAIPFGTGTLVISWVENASGTAGTLTVANGLQSQAYNINGNFSQSSFGAFSDGNGGTEIGVTNAAPPSGNTAVMVMSNPAYGDYEIYDVGGNSIESAYTLGQIAANWNFVGLGTLQAGDSNDMLFRDGASFEAYYVNNNTITSSSQVGSVGTTWSFSGQGNFDGASSLSEMLLRNSSSGAFELYHVQGGGVLAGSSVAAIGNNLQVSGFGYFSETSTEQMAMEQANVSPGSNAYWLYTYNPATNSYGSAGASGTIGSNLSVVGVADMLGNGSSELIMEQANVTPGTNAYWAYMYNPSNNTFDAIDNKALGTVGSNFHVVGFGPLGTAGQDEMLMQDAAGDFEVYKYNSSEGAFDGSSMGAVGSPWVVVGIVDPPGGIAGASTGQLVQAMASMGVSAASNSAPFPALGAGAQSQQTFLTIPPHA